MPEALIDGRPSAYVPVDDRGLLYGDHLFETVAFVAGQAPLWERHMDRLIDSARRLLIPPPDPRLLASECTRLVAAEQRAIVRITLTRGSGGHAYEPPVQVKPRRILTRRCWPTGIESARQRGIVVHTSPVRLAAGGPLVGLKHGNRLEQVLAAEQARRSGVEDALLFDARDRLVEAIAGNLVLILDGRPVTPRLCGAGVAGVGLQWLNEQLGGNLLTQDLDQLSLRRAQAVMVINSVTGIRPVRQLDDRVLQIGEACRRWQRLWDDLFRCAD